MYVANASLMMQAMMQDISASKDNEMNFLLQQRWKIVKEMQKTILKKMRK
jgi:hypothetical protein